MIVDSKQYNGLCACGRTHTMTTEWCIIEAGALTHCDEHIAAHGLGGFAVAIYDENTYAATDGRHPHADVEIVLPPEGLHADEHGVGLALPQIPDGCDYLIAVGAGTVHDITRYCAYELGVPFVSCPTAASVDGFCSSVAAMTWEGFKKTFTAVAPRIVVADLEIIARAPMRLTRSGFGDMIGKYIALAEWRIGRALTGEYLCPTIHDMTMDATNDVLSSAEGIVRGELAAYEKLIYGLLMSGIAMQLLGSSRCASGAEHHISHLIEMQPEPLGLCSDALHGEKVGVGTLLAVREYYRLTDGERPRFIDYPAVSDGEIVAAFGDRLSPSILAENKSDCAAAITAELLDERWGALCDIVRTIPTEATLLEKYHLLGLCSTLSDIGVSEDRTDDLLTFSPLVRDRLTLMRLRRAMR